MSGSASRYFSGEFAALAAECDALDERKVLKVTTTFPHDLMILLVAVTERVDELRSWMAGLSEVVKARRSLWMTAERMVDESTFRVGEGDGYRVEWYAEADLESRDVLSLTLEVAWHPSEWVVDASYRLQTDRGEVVLVELPTRFAVDPDDLVAELTSQVEMLWNRKEEAFAAACP